MYVFFCLFSAINSCMNRPAARTTESLSGLLSRLISINLDSGYVKNGSIFISGRKSNEGNKRATNATARRSPPATKTNLSKIVRTNLTVLLQLESYNAYHRAEYI